MTLAELVMMALLSLQPCARSVYSAVPIVDGVTCDHAFTPGCRQETESECLERYGVIAQAIAEVSGDSRLLAAQLVAVAHGESGFRRDVHAGIGAHARGDLGRSWGLFQRQGRTRRGWQGCDLVGIDLPATRRAAATAGADLIRARAYCAHVVGTGDARCAFNVYGGLISTVVDRRVTARLRSFGRALRWLRPARRGST